MEKIIESLLKVRTPLTIGGLSIVVFYLLYNKILELGIFSNLGEDSTAYVIGDILSKVFYFAVLALIVGVGSYIYLTVLNRKKRSMVTLVDASLDPESKKHTEELKDGIKYINRKTKND
jgi:hypothetical protein